ncbi:MAG: chemotaxis protein CheW [Ekhidna sp.]
MALGKNLKKRKLIANEPEAKENTPVAKKKKSVRAKKELIEKPKAKKKASPQKKVATKAKKQPVAKPLKEKRPVEERRLVEERSPVEEKRAGIDPGLPIFIAKELHQLKNSLRKKYQEDINKLGGVVTQFVVIEIGSELYAVDIDCVKEVVPTSNLSKTPNTPSHIQGIANVRGSTYVVFDLTKKFKLGIEVNSQYLLVLENAGIAAALSLGSLPATRKVNGDNISSEMNMIEDASLDVSYIKGLIQDQDQLIYYLDVIELLKNDKAIVVPDNLTDSKE